MQDVSSGGILSGRNSSWGMAPDAMCQPLSRFTRSLNTNSKLKNNDLHFYTPTGLCTCLVICFHFIFALTLPFTAQKQLFALFLTTDEYKKQKMKNVKLSHVLPDHLLRTEHPLHRKAITICVKIQTTKEKGGQNTQNPKDKEIY